MNDAKSYVAPFELFKPIASGVIAQAFMDLFEGKNKGKMVVKV